MIDWPWLSALLGYTSSAVIALYLQHRTGIAALDRLSEEHMRHTSDLRMMLEVLQLSLLHEQESKTARMNRVTHADLAEGMVSE